MFPRCKLDIDIPPTNLICTTCEKIQNRLNSFSNVQNVMNISVEPFHETITSTFDIVMQ